MTEQLPSERPEVARLLDEDIEPGFWERLEELREFEEARGALDDEEE